MSNIEELSKAFEQVVSAIESCENGREILMKKVADLCKRFTSSPFANNPTDFRKFFEIAEQKGVHVLANHFYNPLPDTSWVEQNYPDKPSEMKGVQVSRDEHESMLTEIFPLYSEEYNEFLWDQPDDFHLKPKFHMNNGAFSGTDALVTYCYIRHFKPRRIIEVGSGFSTLLISAALEKNGEGEITCIEPYPHWFLDKEIYGVTCVVDKCVQEVDLKLFKALEQSDLLFIDSTHVSKVGSDVNHLFFNVIPELAGGVHVHFHDIYLPWEVPKRWICEDKVFWNEQYLLQAFLQYNNEYKTVFSNSYAGAYLYQLFQRCFPKSNWYGGGSIFIQRQIAE